MTRIIVHAGFYKTGTTSLQNYLAANHKALTPWFDYYGPGNISHTGQYAREYAQRPFPWRRRRFARALRTMLAAMPEPASGNIVISRENYTGVMPGHRDWRGRPVIGFPAAPCLLDTITTELQRRFGPEAQIEYLFTTRDRAAWIESLHGHLLRSIPIRDDLAQFTARFPPDYDPEAAAQALARHLAPIPVHTAALEQLGQSRIGPATALLDLLGIPEEVRATLPDARRANTGQQDDLRDAFLALNRQGLSRATLKAEKARLLERET
ncbi:hypothetical protein [Rhodalgimonas zhirmunskyi]|uniref:Sulfotransferase family protein n=1 Tax=Rhodalgimonas zhirmunskyi TaxID=2964767 RepID=A0AAJ1X725_9RHOB|nr:hypothetical protein [Rhodoalgimonas zhirmunskyi]MDQ2095809.1 hypothetical protein [Rhodoalgimonas zhirmunskyi]